MNGLYETNLKEVYRKFAPKMKCLNHFSGEGIDWSPFPNIEKIKLFSVNDELFISQLKLYLAKSKHLDVVIEQGKEYLLQAFIDDFPTLTHFTLTFCEGREKCNL